VGGATHKRKPGSNEEIFFVIKLRNKNNYFISPSLLPVISINILNRIYISSIKRGLKEIKEKENGESFLFWKKNLAQFIKLI
jgi:hypothetical protein